MRTLALAAAGPQGEAMSEWRNPAQRIGQVRWIKQLGQIGQMSIGKMQIGQIRTRQVWMAVVVFCLTALTTAAAAQQTAPPPAGAPQSSSAQSGPAQPGSVSSSPSQSSPARAAGGGQTATHITPDQAHQLFSLVDVLMKFSSDETGLPIKSTVKRQLTTRAAVQSYLEEKFNDDKDAKRMQRDEIVLKKFGLLDRDFDLKPFLLALLKEQIEAYYDAKTKTINLLDWVDSDEQKPVLAHELTHALQDQDVGLEKWDDQTPNDVSVNASGDQNSLAKDEIDTARDAVVEGQATAVMIDYVLKPMGKSLIKDPEVLDIVKDQMTGSDSPVMSRAPLLLSASMLFPYREGLSFEQDVWMDKGQTAAFAGTLSRPPASSWEILNPRYYESQRVSPIPLLPDFHPLVDKLYRPYDIGQVGQLDVRILTELFGGVPASRQLTSAWDGGLYWAGQLRSATTPAEQDSTQSLALFYLSVWKSDESAQAFAKLYADSLGRKYSNLQPDLAAQSSSPTDEGEMEQVFSSSEGSIVLTTRGKMVFVAESFPVSLARKLTALILDAQGAGELRTAQVARPEPSFNQPAMEPLSASLVRFFESCGVMKAAVDPAVEAAR
jgi:hypothetical protein